MAPPGSSAVARAIAPEFGREQRMLSPMRRRESAVTGAIAVKRATPKSSFALYRYPMTGSSAMKANGASKPAGHGLPGTAQREQDQSDPGKREA